MLHHPVVPSIAEEPTAVLLRPSITLNKDESPTAVLDVPEVIRQAACLPKATFPVPVVKEAKALHPIDVLNSTVQPFITPATVGVAGEAPPAAPQQTALEPFDMRT